MQIKPENIKSVRSAVMEVLAEANMPMSAGDITEAVQAKSGMRSYFLVYSLVVEAAWDLAAADQVEITRDWKLCKLN